DVDTPLDAATGKSAEVDADRALTAGRDRRGPGDVAHADPGRVRLGRRGGQEQGGAGHLPPKEGRGRRRVTVGKGGGEPLAAQIRRAAMQQRVQHGPWPRVRVARRTGEGSQWLSSADG